VSVSFALEQIVRRLDDSSTLLLYHSRTAEHDYGEAGHLWRDRRGTSFIRRFAVPMVDSFPRIGAIVADQGRHLRLAQPKAGEAETAIARILGMHDVVVQALSEVIGLTDQAQHLAAAATGRAHEGAAKAETILAGLSALGLPPAPEA